MTVLTTHDEAVTTAFVISLETPTHETEHERSQA